MRVTVISMGYRPTFSALGGWWSREGLTEKKPKNTMYKIHNDKSPVTRLKLGDVSSLMITPVSGLANNTTLGLTSLAMVLGGDRLSKSLADMFCPFELASLCR